MLRIKLGPTPVVLFALFACVTYLAFKGLDNHYFWADEAETAFFSKAFLQTGRISGWDGHTLYTWRNGTLMREDLGTVNPPLMFLTTAASFKVLGYTTFAGRLPHVLIGLLALVMMLLLLRQVSDSRPMLIYGFLLTGFSISFLMYIRCVRYYALCMLFATTTLYLYHQLLQRRKPLLAVSLFVSCVLFYLSNYLLFLSFFVALLSNHCIFHRKAFTIKEYGCLFLIGAPFMLWGLYHSISRTIWIRLDYVGEPKTLHQALLRFLMNLRDLELLVTFPSIAGIAGIILAFTFRKNRELAPLRQFSVFMLIYIAVLSIFSLQTIKGLGGDSYADIRYMVPLIPVGALCTAALCAYVHARAKVLAIALAAAVLLTNFPGLRLGDKRPRFHLTSYTREIHRDHEGPYEAAVAFVRKHIPPGDTLVVVAPDYQPTMLFYLGDDYTFLGYLDTLSLVRTEASKLDAPSFARRHVPQWIAMFGWRHGDAWVKHHAMGKAAFGGDPSTNASRWTVPVYYKDMSRPEIPWHSFHRVERFDRNKDAIYFLQRKQKDAVTGARRARKTEIPPGFNLPVAPISTYSTHVRE
jgi:hypothetical protein